MFDGIAPTYDLLNRVFSLGIDQRWRRRAIRQLDPAKHKRIMDMATGTADVAIQTIKLLPRVEHVTGIDLSRGMLDYGRIKLEKLGLTERISLTQGDSENIPLPDNSFDAATVAFGVRNFGDLERGLSEMQRTIRPGGKLVVLEFSRPQVFPLKQLFNLYFGRVMPLIGRLQSRDPHAYRYLYESVQAFPDGQDFLKVLERSGFKSPTWTPLTFGIASIYTAEKP